jgi:hypothetical protein
MAGPCSLPNGPKAKWEEMNEIVCDKHFFCDMREVDDKGKEVIHDYITYREWLFRRRRLTTGKSV